MPCSWLRTIIRYISILAETDQAILDLTEGKWDLISGFIMEYAARPKSPVVNTTVFIQGVQLLHMLASLLTQTYAQIFKTKHSTYMFLKCITFSKNITKWQRGQLRDQAENQLRVTQLCSPVCWRPVCLVTTNRSKTTSLGYVCGLRETKVKSDWFPTSMEFGLELHDRYFSTDSCL